LKTEIPAQRRLKITRAGAAILLVVAALLLAQRLHTISHRYDQFDFVVFYGWWTDYSNGGDPWTDQLGPMRGCNYTPAFIEIFSPLARLDQKTAFWIWQSAQILCIVIAVLILACGNASPLGTAPTIIVLSLVMLSSPLAAALVWSQVAPMLLALMSAAWFCARRQRPAAAGLWLALAALLKLYPAAAAGYFLFGRHWRALGWTTAFFAAGVLLTNPTHWIELVTHGLPIAYRITGRHGLSVLSFVRTSVAYLAGTRINAEPLFAVWGLTALIDLALIAIAAAATITGGGRADLDALAFGLWVALALLMSPLAWRQDFILLLPACLFGLRAAWQRFQPREPTRNLALLAGGAMLAYCVVSALIKAVPGPGFVVLLATYLGAALVFRARMRSESRRAEAETARDRPF
jgi:Glycosyltransferase family 87